jgi:hypothetical protein
MKKDSKKPLPKQAAPKAKKQVGEAIKERKSPLKRLQQTKSAQARKKTAAKEDGATTAPQEEEFQPITARHSSTSEMANDSTTIRASHSSFTAAGSCASMRRSKP